MLAHNWNYDARRRTDEMDPAAAARILFWFCCACLLHAWTGGSARATAAPDPGSNDWPARRTTAAWAPKEFAHRLRANNTSAEIMPLAE